MFKLILVMLLIVACGAVPFDENNAVNSPTDESVTTTPTPLFRVHHQL